MSIRSMNARSSASIARALDEALVEAVGQPARVEAVLEPAGPVVVRDVISLLPSAIGAVQRTLSHRRAPRSPPRRSARVRGRP